MKRRVLSILILGANLLNVAAQNMTSSPVSMFGLGELSTGEAEFIPVWVESALHCVEKM